MTETSSVQIQNQLLAAVDELFAKADAPLTLASGRVVNIKAAKVKQLRQITAFIQSFLSGFADGELGQLIAAVSTIQQKQLEEGVDPYKMRTDDIVRSVAANGLAFTNLLDTVLAQLPSFICIFTDLSEDDVNGLELDELAVVAFGVFGRNYAFFTRQVLPVIRACIAHLSQKRS